MGAKTLTVLKRGKKLTWWGWVCFAQNRVKRKR